MKFLPYCGLLIAALTLSASPVHANLIIDLFCNGTCAPSQSAGCPDDYVPKPPPSIACSNRFTNKDDYCAKPLPAPPPPVRLGCRDNYCAKGGMIIAAVGSGPAYRCVPQQPPPAGICVKPPTCPK